MNKTNEYDLSRKFSKVSTKDNSFLAMYYCSNASHQNYFIFQPLYRSLRLYISNYVKTIAWKTIVLSTEEISPPFISFAPEVIHFYNGKPSIKFINCNFSAKNIFFIYRKVVNIPKI